MQTKETDFMPGASESSILAGVRRFVMKNGGALCLQQAAVRCGLTQRLNVNS